MNSDKLYRLKQNEVMVKRAALVSELLETVPGIDLSNASLAETPWRVAKLFDEIFKGYNMNPEQILKDAMFSDIPADDLVIIKDIPLFSTCAHHILPFFGKCHIAYIPKENKVVGISKMARIVEVFARRAQEQERIGHEIANCIVNVLDPLGVAVIIEAEHTCMTTRGASAIGAKTTTSCLRGVFKLDGKARTELYQALGR